MESPTRPSEHATVVHLRTLESPCRLCPRVCGAKRAEGARGICGMADAMVVFVTNLHHGEEPPISGARGSGTVFFSGCNLRCAFCQNHGFSQLLNGKATTPDQLAEQMLVLQRRGAHNINWVTPTPHVPKAAEALMIAREKGLTIPLVYNCSGYETLEVLRMLDGIVDIYLPDAKYADSAPAQKYSGAADYPEVNRAALREMWRQVGPLTLDDEGIATKGMLVRHLVLPEGKAGTHAVLEFLARELGTEVGVSLMRQYFPVHRAHEHPEIDRRITCEEYEDAMNYCEALGFTTAFIQEWEDE